MRQDPHLRIPLKDLFWALVLLVPLGSCATGHTKGERTPQPERQVPPDDLVCDENDDCEIVVYNVYYEECCGACEEEPYAISRAAIERQKTRYKAACAGVACKLIETCGSCCCTKRADWIAVCDRHLCKRRSAKFFGSPKPRCS